MRILSVNDKHRKETARITECRERKASRQNALLSAIGKVQNAN